MSYFRSASPRLAFGATDLRSSIPAPFAERLLPPIWRRTSGTDRFVRSLRVG